MTGLVKSDLSQTYGLTSSQSINIKVYNKDGNLGLKEKAPFDRILVSAACKEAPEKLLEQLKQGG